VEKTRYSDSCADVAPMDWQCEAISRVLPG